MNSRKALLRPSCSRCGRFRPTYIIFFFASVSVVAAEEDIGTQASIDDLNAEIERIEREIAGIQQDFLLKHQTRAQLDGYIEEISSAYSPPRPEDIEKTLWDFERIREEADSDIRYYKGEAQKLDDKYAALKIELSELRRELIESGFSEPFPLIAEKEDPEDAAIGRGSDEAIDMILGVEMKARKDIEVLAREVYARKGDAEEFIRLADEVRLEAQKESDRIYEQMNSRYVALKQRGVGFIAPPRKPAGYDDRAAALPSRNNAVVGAPKPPVRNPSQGPKLSEIEQLEIAIANTSDPQEKANLEEQLELLKSAQN